MTGIVEAAACETLPDICEYLLLAVLCVDPAEAAPVSVVVPECRMLEIEMIYVTDIIVVFSVVLMIQHEPLQAFVVAPLDELGQLMAHEIELFAGVCHLIHGEQADTRKLAPDVTRHLADQRKLAVYDLVM